jgi:phasin
VIDANVKVEGKANSANEVSGSGKRGFDIPLFAIPGISGIFSGFAEQGVARAKESCEKMKATSEEIAEIVKETYSTNAKGAADYGAKVIEISGENTNSAFDFFTHLMETRSVSDIVSLSAAQSRKTFEAATVQNRELWELAQRVATETAEPIKKSFAKVLQKAS